MSYFINQQQMSANTNAKADILHVRRNLLKTLFFEERSQKRIKLKTDLRIK